MSIKLGPVLRFHGSDTNQWRVSVLLVVENTPNTPTVTYGLPPTNAQHQPIGSRTFSKTCQWKILRYDLTIPLTTAAQQITYSVDGQPYSFFVPAKDSLPRCSYASCNGFSDPKLMKNIVDQNERWSDMGGQHSVNPYHLFIMGGDQIYSDSMWQALPTLREWSEADNRFKLQFTKQMQKEVGDFFYQMYVKRWSQVQVGQVLSSIPTLMMWDDHDIFDGWGSYPDVQQNSPVYQGMFNLAKECFCIFQLHGDLADNGILPNQDVYNGSYVAGKLGILAMDLRSERTQEQVVSPKSWNAIYQWMDDIQEHQLDHLFVMSSIPLVHADFNTLETMLGTIPGQQELEDDLRDHWQSRPHRAERIRLIRRLLDFAAAKKCRVTLLSGDVHVAALGAIESNRHGTEGNAHIINQLTSSAIVHPAPNGTALFFLNQIAGDVEIVERGISAQLVEFPTTRHCFISGRNWLSLEPDQDGLNRYWANWRVEGEKYPYTKVIHSA